MDSTPPTRGIVSSGRTSTRPLEHSTSLPFKGIQLVDERSPHCSLRYCFLKGYALATSSLLPDCSGEKKADHSECLYCSSSRIVYDHPRSRSTHASVGAAPLSCFVLKKDKVRPPTS